MTLGALTESIQVTGGAPMIESESAALGNVIENRKIVNLPLNTRNPFQLALLSPGVIPSPNMGDAFNNSANFMINGNRGNVSEMLIDGSPTKARGATRRGAQRDPRRVRVRVLVSNHARRCLNRP
jgi:hypothetical protein